MSAAAGRGSENYEQGKSDSHRSPDTQKGYTPGERTGEDKKDYDAGYKDANNGN